MSLREIYEQLKSFEKVFDMEKYLWDIGRRPHYEYDILESFRMKAKEQDRLFKIGKGLYYRQPSDDDRKYRESCIANAIKAYQEFPLLFEFYDEYEVITDSQTSTITSEETNENSQLLLEPELLAILSKKELSVEDKIKAYELTANFCCHEYGNKILNVVVEHINNPERPISQVGFIIDFDNNNQFKHLIIANDFYLNDFPIERVILVACHESAHIEWNEQIARTLDFTKNEDIEKYKAATARNDNKEWYFREEEKRADARAFFIAKNIFQRAVHDTADFKLKERFWSSYSLLKYNEEIEMSKHNSGTNIR